MANLKNTTINDTGFLQLPSGTTAQRPGSAAAGQMRYNTSINSVEWYDAEYSSWFPAGFIPPIATGGTVTDITQGGVNYRVHTFTSVGTSTFTVTRAGQVEFLIVAGGGGGGSGYTSGTGASGGGGAGGVLQGSTTLNIGTYAIIVGNGGQNVANDGQSSSFASYTAIGGGGGSYDPATATYFGRSGGSGGGGADPVTDVSASIVGIGLGTPGQGNSGGPARRISVNGGGSGGGGGAGSPGSSGFTGKGGSGVSSLISGSIQFYGGGGSGVPESGATVLGGLGGGGTGATDIANSTAGAPNTGGGGGGTRGTGGGAAQAGKPGGSGIVIVRYRTS